LSAVLSAVTSDVTSDVTLLFENRRDLHLLDAGLLFSAPLCEVICWEAEDLNHSLKQLDTLRRDGYYLAGCLSYEAGYVLRGLPHLLNSLINTSSVPLLHFFAFQAPKKLNAFEVEVFLGRNKAAVKTVGLDITRNNYQLAFDRIQQHILNGDTYQVNFTSKYHFSLEGSSRGLYQLLRERQKVAYSALFNMPGYDILSLSPELFFSKVNNKLYAKPMKGTMPRATDVKQDQANRAFLTDDIKSRAENTMIVDLLRNDLSAISLAGSVVVSKLLEVESYETVHQMTSSIESDVAVDLNFSEIIQALFPCGSITGVPKRRTMEIIHDLECAPRGIYTGAMGYITPQNDMCFNVPIRTLICRDGAGELGAGGGIIHDSNMQSEFEELQLKARFFTGLI
jgi:para-aminobenzoate synthetase / 4-amino-4-deoxychorismate lyase